LQKLYRNVDADIVIALESGKACKNREIRKAPPPAAYELVG
jgi:hypothetical protein